MTAQLYRLAPGIVDYTTLTTTDAYLVSNFPVTGTAYDWLVGTDGVLSVYRDRTTAPSGISFGLGGMATVWNFSILGRGQVEYLLDTYAPGKLTAQVTLLTWRFNNQSATGDGRDWVALTALMTVDTGKLSSDTDNVNDAWYKDFKLTFSRCVIVPEP